MKILNLKKKRIIFVILFILLIFSLQRTRHSQVDIHVFAWRRGKSLSRLLQSLNKAYYSQKVLLIVHVDGGESEEVDRVLWNFKWKFGKEYYKIQWNLERKGMKEMMINAWDGLYGKYAIFLEDDVEVSPMFFKYSWKCIQVLNKKNVDGLIGCSLYTPRLDELSMTIDPQNPPLWNFRNITLDNYVYYQLPCSWGAIYEEKNWKKFIKYLKYRIQNTRNLEFPLRSNNWEQSWKRFLIEWMYAKGQYLLYPNFKDQISFSTNYYEEGVHSVPEGNQVVVPDRLRVIPDARFQVPLVQEMQDFKDFPNSTREIQLISIYNQFARNHSELLTAGREWMNSKVYKLDPEAYKMLV